MIVVWSGSPVEKAQASRYLGEGDILYPGKESKVGEGL